MGAKLICCLLSLLLLSGCAETISVPYSYVAEGVYMCGDTVWEDGVARDRTPTDKQALQYITDANGVNLYPCGLVTYTGTLYDLSNYRELLLENGYVITTEVRTSNMLDTVLLNGDGRVRLIYLASGSIRILFEKPESVAHILLKEGTND